MNYTWTICTLAEAEKAASYYQAHMEAIPLILAGYCLALKRNYHMRCYRAYEGITVN